MARVPGKLLLEQVGELGESRFDRLPALLRHKRVVGIDQKDVWHLKPELL